jgi:hypothetical protein
MAAHACFENAADGFAMVGDTAASQIYRSYVDAVQKELNALQN